MQQQKYQNLVVKIVNVNAIHPVGVKGEKMKLSEAILLGASMNKQAFGTYKDKDGGTCALGAAMEAVGCLASVDPGIDEQVLIQMFLKQKFPLLLKRKGLGQDITRWNDEVHASRETIAKEVERIENEEEKKMELKIQNNSEAPKDILLQPITA